MWFDFRLKIIIMWIYTREQQFSSQEEQEMTSDALFAKRSSFSPGERANWDNLIDHCFALL